MQLLGDEKDKKGRWEMGNDDRNAPFETQEFCGTRSSLGPPHRQLIGAARECRWFLEKGGDAFGVKDAVDDQRKRLDPRPFLHQCLGKRLECCGMAGKGTKKRVKIWNTQFCNSHRKRESHSPASSRVKCRQCLLPGVELGKGKEKKV